MRKKDNRTKRNASAKMSAKGVAVVMLAVVGIWWLGDCVVRQVRSKDADPKKGIVAEGTFAGDVKATEAPETQAPETKPVSETQIAEFQGSITFTIPDNCVPISQDQSALHSGKLLLLDSEHSYTGYEGALGDFSEHNDSYRLRFGDLEIQPAVADAMNKMATAYETVMDGGKLLVYSTTSAVEANGSLYPDALPDRATGYCIDLGILNEDETISPLYDGNIWLENNAYLYGFVCSYPAEDAELTGIAGAPYHLRYVGRVHANIMHEEGLTLTGYLEAVKSHTVNAPYTYNDGNNTYSVYYVPASDAGATDVPVPLGGDYEISGNNTDGYIVLTEGRIK